MTPAQLFTLYDAAGGSPTSALSSKAELLQLASMGYG